jgi:hypothetical protein
MRFQVFCPAFLLLVLAGCGQAPEHVQDVGGEAFAGGQRIEADVSGDRELVGEGQGVEPDDSALSGSAPPVYWGIEEGEALPLVWEDLMPVGGSEALEAEYMEFYDMLSRRYGAGMADGFAADLIEEGSELDYMPQLGSFETVPELEGVLVRIPGYMVPLGTDRDGRQSAFLFAPYMGACIHTPPPPPNQLIYVEADPPVRLVDMYTPLWVQGILSASREDTDLASAAYTLRLELIEPYGQPR